VRGDQAAACCERGLVWLVCCEGRVVWLVDGGRVLGAGRALSVRARAEAPEGADRRSIEKRSGRGKGIASGPSRAVQRRARRVPALRHLALHRFPMNERIRPQRAALRACGEGPPRRQRGWTLNEAMRADSECGRPRVGLTRWECRAGHPGHRMDGRLGLRGFASTRQRGSLSHRSTTGIPSLNRKTAMQSEEPSTAGRQP
jgi:hypothetical protein